MEDLAHQQTNLRSGHETRLEAHAHQSIQHEAFHPPLDSVRLVEMEARARQNTNGKAMTAFHHGKLYELVQQIEQRKHLKESGPSTSQENPGVRVTEVPAEPKSQRGEDDIRNQITNLPTDPKPHGNDDSAPTETRPRANEDGARVSVTDAPTESKPHVNEDGGRDHVAEAPTDPKTHANDGRAATETRHHANEDGSRIPITEAPTEPKPQENEDGARIQITKAPTNANEDGTQDEAPTESKPRQSQFSGTEEPKVQVNDN